MDTTTTYQCAEHCDMNECHDECDVYFCKHGIDVFRSAMSHADVLNFKNRKCPTLHKCACGVYLHTDDELRRTTQERERKSVESTAGNWYLITLTQPEVDKTVDARIKAANKIIKSKQVMPEQWCYSLELTEKGTPHIHIALFTYKYPEYRFINKFNDGHIVNIRREKFNVKNYVVKNDTKPTEEQLRAWNLNTWFYCSDNYSGPRPNEKSEI